MGIPVVDLGSLSGRDHASESGTVADLVEAFSGIGFVFITGHDVGLETLTCTDVQRAWRDSNPRPSGP